MTLARRASEEEAKYQLHKKWYITIIDLNWKPIRIQWESWINCLLDMLSFGYNEYWIDIAAKAKSQLVWTKFYNLLP